MQSLYVEGNTFLHRLAPSLKLGGLIVFSIALFLTGNLIVLGALLAVSVTLYFCCR
nr:hypothetical protein [Marinicella sp. W31]MDC2877762.1 hypothetical protein [Marinicella sp. W31]